MNKIRGWIQKWLGIVALIHRTNELYQLYSDLVSIGVDVHFKSPHMILIYSQLKGGQIRHIEANFASISELNSFVEELKGRFHTEQLTYDFPHGYDRRIFETEEYLKMKESKNENL